MTFHAAACQTDFPCPSTRAEIKDRTTRMCSIIEQTVIGYEPFFDVRLLAFPAYGDPHVVAGESAIAGLAALLHAAKNEDACAIPFQAATARGCCARISAARASSRVSIQRPP